MSRTDDDRADRAPLLAASPEPIEPVGEASKTLSSYFAKASTAELPPQVVARAKAHLLDGIASIVSGSVLPAGESARDWVTSTAGANGGPCLVLGSRLRADPFVAALANGMAAHADETDDSHAATTSHPGCAVIPAALAGTELANGGGPSLLRAVVAGYDLGCRVARTVSSALVVPDESRPSSHALVGLFGAAGAAGVALGFDASAFRRLLTYTAQQSSGVRTYLKAPDHSEKAFVYGGMPACHGLLAATLVRAGAAASEDIFEGSVSWLETFCPGADTMPLVAGLGTDYELLNTTMKKYAVGSPAASAIEALLQLRSQRPFDPQQVERLTVRLYARGAAVVGDRAIPSINLRYLLVGTLMDGKFSFQMAHDDERLERERLNPLWDRVEIIADPALSRDDGSQLSVALVGSGEVLQSDVTAVRGAPEDPMPFDEVTEKAFDLLAPVLGADRAQEVCDVVRALERVDAVAELTELLSP